MTCVLLLSYSHHTSQATLSQYAFNMDVDEALPPPPRDPSPSPVSDPEEGRHEDDLRAAADVSKKATGKRLHKPNTQKSATREAAGSQTVTGGEKALLSILLCVRHTYFRGILGRVWIDSPPEAHQVQEHDEHVREHAGADVRTAIQPVQRRWPLVWPCARAWSVTNLHWWQLQSHPTPSQARARPGQRRGERSIRGSPSRTVGHSRRRVGHSRRRIGHSRRRVSQKASYADGGRASLPSCDTIPRREIALPNTDDCAL